MYECRERQLVLRYFQKVTHCSKEEREEERFQTQQTTYFIYARLYNETVFYWNRVLFILVKTSKFSGRQTFQSFFLRISHAFLFLRSIKCCNSLETTKFYWRQIFPNVFLRISHVFIFLRSIEHKQLSVQEKATKIDWTSIE